jgi:hypothetical protein
MKRLGWLTLALTFILALGAQSSFAADKSWGNRGGNYGGYTQHSGGNQGGSHWGGGWNSYGSHNNYRNNDSHDRFGDRGYNWSRRDNDRDDGRFGRDFGRGNAGLFGFFFGW